MVAVGSTKTLFFEGVGEGERAQDKDNNYYKQTLVDYINISTTNGVGKERESKIATFFKRKFL